MSDEKKKNNVDNFELHLELRNSKNIVVVLIVSNWPAGFNFQVRADYPPNCKDKFFAIIVWI